MNFFGKNLRGKKGNLSVGAFPFETTNESGGGKKGFAHPPFYEFTFDIAAEFAPQNADARHSPVSPHGYRFPPCTQRRALRNSSNSLLCCWALS